MSQNNSWPVFSPPNIPLPLSLPCRALASASGRGPQASCNCAAAVFSLHPPRSTHRRCLVMRAGSSCRRCLLCSHPPRLSSFHAAMPASHALPWHHPPAHGPSGCCSSFLSPASRASTFFTMLLVACLCGLTTAPGAGLRLHTALLCNATSSLPLSYIPVHPLLLHVCVPHSPRAARWAPPPHFPPVSLNHRL